MTKILKAITLATLAMVALPADAAIVFNFSQVGNDVQLTGSGSLDLNNAQIVILAGADGFVDSGSGALAVGNRNPRVPAYRITSSAGAFGTGSFVDGSQDAGSLIGIDALGAGGFVYLNQGYISGTTISGTTTFVGRTLANLGLVAGSYLYSIPNDTITVNIPGAIPEPTTWTMMLVGFGLIGATTRYRRRHSTVRYA